MSVDWGELTPRLRSGEWTCATHGRIAPRTNATVPACPDCGRAALRVEMHRTAGHPVFVEPRPSHCAGPDRHPLGPGLVHLGWLACSCAPVVAAGARAHRLWTCQVCGDEQRWPPCEAGQ